MGSSALNAKLWTHACMLNVQTILKRRIGLAYNSTLSDNSKNEEDDDEMSSNFVAFIVIIHNHSESSKSEDDLDENVGSNITTRMDESNNSRLES